MQTNALAAYFYSVIFLLFFGQSLLGQSQQFLFTHIGVQQGLATETVNAVQQDSRGYLWIASQGALQRFDGQRFKTLFNDKRNPYSIPQGNIRCLQIDSKDRLWMLADKNILGYLDTKTLRFHRVKVSVPSSDIAKAPTALHLTQDGHLLMIYVGETFLTYNDEADEASQKYNPFKLPGGWKPLYIWQDHNNNYWVGSNAGLLKFNPANKKMSYRDHNEENDPVIHEFKDTKTVVFAYLDKSNRFWLTAWPDNSMFFKSFDLSSKAVTVWQHLIGKQLKGIYYELHGITEQKNGSLWIAGGNLFARVNYHDKTIDPVLNNSPGEYSIRYDNISQLYEDKEENIWVCTNKGLFRFNPGAQVFSTLQNRLPGRDTIFTPDVTDILQMPDGEILVSTWGNGVFAYDKNFRPVTSKYINRNFPSGDGMTWCMTRMKNGDIWRGIQEGSIFISKPNGQHLKVKPPILENSTVRQVEEDHNGNIWIGTQKGDLIKWNAVSNSFSLCQRLKSVITRIYIDKQNFVWVCTDHNGIYRINNVDGRITEAYSGETDAGLPGTGAADIVQYDDSTFLIAGDGLIFLNIRKNKFSYLLNGDEAPSFGAANIFNILVDKNKYIWMGTSRGIVSYHLEKRKLSTYNASDGVHTNSFSVAGAGILNDGRMAFGTNHDVLIFDPEKLASIEYIPPKVQISGISVMNNSMLVDSVLNLGKLEIPHDAHSLSIDLSTLTYQNKFMIQYIMEGLNDEWQSAGNLNQVVFNYLPPGRYTFKAATLKEDGTPGKITALEIFVEAPFWKTWWFYSLLVLTAIFIIYLADRQRIYRMRREQEIRSGIAANLHQDVNTTLQNINVLSEIAGMKADVHPEQSKDYIHEIKQKSRNMVTAMDDVLWSIDPANDNMNKTFDRLKEFTQSMRISYNADISVQVASEVKDVNLDMKKRHEFMVIYKLAITTLVENMKGDKVTVVVDIFKGSLSLKIFATVKNIYKAGNQAIKNINEIKKRAAAIDSAMDFLSDETGTTLILVIRIK